jgi:hypothetical protein
MKIKLKFVIALTTIITILLTQIFGIQIVNASETEYRIPGGALLFDSDTGTITGFSGTPTIVEIPNEINGVEVTSIEDTKLFWIALE